ncbi:MAG: pilus assembly protein N-terminal domain-containing protein [Myxococcales bacterium]|nr:pilus assembly protein N-terminal domain-containing protein [Myxococcales bacterium]
MREILGYDPNAPIVVLQQPPRQKPAAKPMAGERVTIIVGGTHRISVPSFERVDIAQPAIATVELESPGVLLVTALKAGNTTLTWSTQDRQTWAIPVTVKAK